MEIDQEIIDDFLEQLGVEMKELHNILGVLAVDKSKSELFEQAGQISDRIFGAVAMFDFGDFAPYCRKVKEMSYKCSHSDPEHEKARTKVYGILSEYLTDLQFIQDNIGTVDVIKKNKLRYSQMMGKIDRLLSSYLHGIGTGSVAFKDDQKFIFVYDKSTKIEFGVKNAGKPFVPAPKFFNMLAGFQKHFERERDKVYGVIIDTSDDKWTSIVKEIRSYDPIIPIIITTKKVKGLGKIDRKKLQIQGLVATTTPFQKIVDAFKNAYKKRALLEKQQTSQPPSADGEFVQVSTRVFKTDMPTPFDTYIKVGQRYVKVASKGEPFDLQVVTRHIEKGVDFYYIIKEEHDAYLNQIKSEVDAIYTNPDIGFVAKKETFFDYALDVQCFFEESNVDAQSLEMVQEFVERSEQLIKEVKQQTDALDDFFSDVMAMEHATSIALMAGLFLNHIDAKKSIYDDIALACYLHDVALKDADEVIRGRNIELMNDEQKKEYYAHPAKSAKILIENGIKPTLAEAVKQHHMRYDGSGFPKRSADIPLNPIAEVIGLAHDFLEVVQQCDGTEEEPVQKFLAEKSSLFSPRMQNVFRYAFVKD